MKKVLVAGSFDGFHVGHQFFIQQGIDLSGSLVVVVARDKTIERIKGRLPRNRESQRLDHICSIYTGITSMNPRLGRSDGSVIDLLKEESPDILLLGYDQDFKVSFFKSHFPDLKIYRAKAYNPHIFKSSKWNSDGLFYNS